jgi:hypothetical protein
MRLPNTQGLDSAWRWVQQQKAAGAFRGEVIGPLGLEMKVKRGPHAERLAQNLEQVITYIRVTICWGCKPGNFRHQFQHTAALRYMRGLQCAAAVYLEPASAEPNCVVFT